MLMSKKRFLKRINPKLLLGVAHRGLHSKSVTENSPHAFKNALEADIAIELDVHLTSDNRLIVCHDEDLLRTTGKSGIIEYLSFDEIRNNYRLLNGEFVPSLGETLEMIDERVPLVIELKVFEKNYKKLAVEVSKVLDKYVKDKRNFLLISFDPRCLWNLRKTGIMRSMLVAKSHFFMWKYSFWCDSVDVEDCLLEYKKVKKYCKKHFSIVYTIDNEEQLKKTNPFVDTITFQYLDPCLIKNR